MCKNIVTIVIKIIAVCFIQINVLQNNALLRLVGLLYFQVGYFNLIHADIKTVYSKKYIAFDVD